MAEVRDLPLLPPGHGHGGDGHDWREAAEHGSAWRAIAGWGRDGWDLGEWPYVMVLTCAVQHTERGLAGEVLSVHKAYGVATYCEGDITVEAFDSHEERIRAIDDIAAFYWRRSSRMPHVPPIGPLGEEYTGPFDWDRAAAGAVHALEPGEAVEQ